MRAIIIKTTLPVITGDEAIAVGYDMLNSISLNDPNFTYQQQRTAKFVKAIKYLNSPIVGLDNLPESATGTGKWLTASILGGGWNETENNRYVDEENTNASGTGHLFDPARPI